ncbi:hypothetical protein FEM48_Zijuj01G0209800 [Ziziphus jujuba var. spinosa]|uniref:Uncharacterized protein n=1 Tax=Ziziphus jujuba var. spinosa TaxID=714518 RepID=A0A978W3I9_ZIZJJ|nr:hypothetical protein FEM48_Zijuj01G0209800 [Ziziphus jujuba var. spinosa]
MGKIPCCLKRCGKSCRLRWTNYLRPDIKRGRFSFEEEETIIQLHSVLGNKWSAIAARLPGRTDNEIKNYWNTHIRKRLMKMGIDPVTHAPRMDLLELSSLLSSTLYNNNNNNNNNNSSQINVPNLLGIGPILNPNLINLATALLSCQSTKTSTPTDQFLLQNLQENQQLGQTQINQNQQFQPFQPNLLQNPIRDSQTCTTATTTTTSSTAFLNENQLSQDQNLTNLSDQGLFSIPNTGYHNLESYHHHPMENQAFVDPSNCSNSFANMSFSSLLSCAPSSSSTPLNSCSVTYVNSSNEDERDSFCSNLMMYDIHNSLNIANELL